MVHRTQPADDQKMRELILYLATKSTSDPRFSSTKLNKLLFYCDFSAYQRLGRSISGHAYQKLQFGPAPKAMLPLLETMRTAGDCDEIEAEHFGLRQRRVIARRPPNVSVFTPEELFLADQVVTDLWENTAKEVSQLSHDFIGWKAAEIGETIPYETVFVGDPATPVSDEEAAFCRTLALAD